MTRHLITSALPYINGVKHLGNLIGSMLPADVYARYLRRRGHEVLFLCATDEHGTPAELAALGAGMDVADYCARQHALQARLAEGFRLSFDHFGRSSSAENRELTQHMARRLDANGFVEERVTKQVYSIADRRFLPDRYVVGTCPRCGYDAARGDQCEQCTRVLDPPDLIEPRSALSGSAELEVRDSRHLFLLQSKLAGQIAAWIETRTDWPVLATSIARKWLNEGLQDRSITRDLRWGVPVERPGFERKVFYVWFDAPVEYIAAAKEWHAADPAGRDWKRWWFAADDVVYTQFMGKDNVPFHTIGFPCTLIGTGEPWKLPDYIKAFNWLTYYGGKFSTSRHVGVFMSDALDLLPADYWRYYLVANAPESDDSSFTWETFAVAVNADLVGTLGNFVNRALTLSRRQFGGTVPAGGRYGAAETRLAGELAAVVRAYEGHLDRLQFRKAAQQLRAAWALGNAYLERTEPWRTVRTAPDDAAASLRMAANLVRLFAVLSEPIIPDTCRAMRAMVEADSEPDPAWPGGDLLQELSRVEGGAPLAEPVILFRKLAPEQIDAWRARFGAEPAG